MGLITSHQDVISARYKPDDYVGRVWLREAAEEFRGGQKSRHMVIVGEPGSGKSTFLAYLATNWNCPRHFVRGDNQGGVAGVDARAFLMSIGAQLYQRYGADLFPRVPRSTNVVSAWTSGRSEVVGRWIDELYTLPFLPVAGQHVAVSAGITSGGSRVVGERISRMVDVTLALDELTLLHVAVLDPVRRLQQIDPGEVVVILVDALDEAVQRAATGPGLVDVIPRPADSDLPENLKFLMTSRPGNHLLRFAEGTLLNLDTETGGYRAKQRSDARALIDLRLGRSPYREAVAAWPLSERAAFVSELERKSDGNFLYLHYFFEASSITPQWGEAGTGYVVVPSGLDGIFRTFAVEKIKGDVTLEAWISLYLPLLGVLAVLRDPVDSRLLARFARVDSGAAAFIVAELQPFLDIQHSPDGDRYRLYHTSFAEYLLDRRRNRDYPLDAKRYHRLIAESYSQEAGGSWTEGTWRSAADDYALRNLSVHLRDAGDSDSLVALLRSDAWFEAHRGSDPTASGYTADALVAWASAESFDDGSAPTPARLAQQVSASLAFCSVRSLSYSIPSTLVGQLLERKMWSDWQVLAAIGHVEEPAARADMLVAAVPHLGAEHLAAALEVGLSLPRDQTQAEVLVALAPHLPGALVNRAVDGAWAIEPVSWRARAVSAMTGRADPALADEAFQLAVSVSDPWERLSTIAEILPQLDTIDHDSAIRAVLDAESEWRNALMAGRVRGNEQSLVEAIDGLASWAGDDDRAELVARGLFIARAISDSGEIDVDAATVDGPVTVIMHAREVADGTAWSPHPGTRAIALAIMAPHCKPPTRDKVAMEAAEAARSVRDPYDRADTLVAVATRLKDLGAIVLNDAVDALAHVGTFDLWIRLLPVLPIEPRLQLAAELALAAQDEGDPSIRGQRLGAVVSTVPEFFSDTAVDRAVSEARVVADQQQRATALGALIGEIPEGRRQSLLAQLNTALESATMAQQRVSADVMDLIALLIEAGEPEAAAHIADGIRLSDATMIRRLPRKGAKVVPIVVAVAASAAPDQRDRLLLAAVAALDKTLGLAHSARAWALLAGALPSHLLATARSLAEQYADPASRALGLAALSPYVPGDPSALREAIAALDAVELDISRAGVITAFPDVLPTDIQTELVRLARSLEAPHAAALALVSLSRRGSLSDRDALLNEAMSRIDSAPDEPSVGHAIADMAPYLPKATAAAAIAVARRLGHPGTRALAIASVLATLPQPRARSIIQEVMSAVEMAVDQGDVGSSADALILIADELDGPQLQMAFSSVIRFPTTMGATRLLHAVARAAADRFTAREMYQRWTATLHDEALTHRSRFVLSLVAMRPVLAALMGQGAHQRLFDEIVDAAERWP